jgi:hypothetical protein
MVFFTSEMLLGVFQSRGAVQELCAMMIRAAFASVHPWPDRVLDAAAG